VVLEVRGVPEALSDEGSAGREVRARVILLFIFNIGILCLASEEKNGRMLMWMFFMNTRRKLGFNA
jgi:hypothetical protein